MQTVANVEITGYNELIAKIKQLDKDPKKKAAMIAVLRRVAAYTVQVGKREAPKSKSPHLVSGKRTREVIKPGSLRKSIGVIVARRGEAKNNPTVVVGPRAKGANKGWYGHFVNNGHNIYQSGFKRKHSASEKARAHNARGASGRVAANPFMGRTYQITKGQASAQSAEGIAKYIQTRIDQLSTAR